MNAQNQGCAGVIVGGLAGALVTFLICLRVIVCYADELALVKRQAIEHGVAEYDSTTGAWRWKDNLTGETK